MTKQGVTVIDDLMQKLIVKLQLKGIDTKKLEDVYGAAHTVTHAQVEMKGMSSGLVLYSLITSDYDNKGNYRG